jgi:hypothetical protein
VSDVTCFIGCDPGPTCGLAVAYWDGTWQHPGAYQCDAASAAALLGWLVELNAEHSIIGGGVPVRAQVEEFRPGTGAGSRGAAAKVTRDLVEELKAVLVQANVPVHVRPAASAKPWSTDKRLERAGLLAVTAGMPNHSRDAMRHLLYCAVHDGGVPDPLSKRGRP